MVIFNLSSVYNNPFSPNECYPLGDHFETLENVDRANRPRWLGGEDQPRQRRWLPVQGYYLQDGLSMQIHLIGPWRYI